MWRLAAAALLAVIGPFGGPADAQTYPDRPIRFIVPFPAGGPADIIGRLLAEKLAESLGQPVVIENRGGAGGAAGTLAIARAEPDGHTVGISSAGALAISPSLQERLGYDPVKDLEPLTLAARVPELLVVARSVKAASLPELIALAKAEPGRLNFASSGPGSMPHLAGELLKLNAGIDIVHAPYRGAAPAVNDVVGGHVQMMFMDIAVLLPHVRSGAVRALAIGSRERAASLPDLPTTAELGLPQVEADNWYALVGPRGMPAAVLARLVAAMRTALQEPDIKVRLADQGAIAIGNTPRELAAYLDAEIAKWTGVVGRAGLGGR